MIARDKETELLFNGTIALLPPLAELRLLNEDNYAKTLEFASDTAKNILSLSDENPYEGCRG
jgi:hypothetical protein